MKKTLLTLSLLLAALAGFGQKIKFTDNTNMWTVLVTYHNATNIITELASYAYTADTVVDSQQYKILPPYLVREDIVAKKVYIRYNDLAHGLVDSEDRVLYNYNLHFDDTMYSHQFFGDYKSWVTNVDSTRINSTWHKVWHFTGHKDGGNGFYYYNVIEGIGCTNGFDYPVNTPEPDGANQLVCFVNNGTNPHLSKEVASYGMYCLSSMDFDNTSNCPVGIEDVTAKTDAILFPNPVNEISRVVLPYTIAKGSFTIINQVGQVISSTSIFNTAEVPVGNNIRIPGVYMYRVTDNNNGKVFSGRFVY